MIDGFCESIESQLCYLNAAQDGPHDIGDEKYMSKVAGRYQDGHNSKVINIQE